MNINATALGICVLLLAFSMGAVCYYLGRRTTQHPVVAGFIGFVFALMPPVALVYCVVLLFRKDLSATSSAVSGQRAVSQDPV